MASCDYSASSRWARTLAGFFNDDGFGSYRGSSSRHVQMAAFGASRPLRPVPAIASFLNPQPTLSLGGGNWSSCSEAVIPRRQSPSWREERKSRIVAGTRKERVLTEVTIRLAGPTDFTDLRRAVVELQEHERRLSSTRLPGDQIADAYVAWLQQQAHVNGAVLIAEVGGIFAGFVVGWVVEDDNIAETVDSNRAGYISDICVMPPYRGQRIAFDLLSAIERYLAPTGITRVRLGALAANAPARAAYERAGFEPYEIIYEKRVGKR
jgi:ribosomal protein S18 acetylase RimI-like enzyme